MQTNTSGGFVVTFMVTGDGTGSFHTDFDLFKPENEKLFVIISITLNADSVACFVLHYFVCLVVFCVNDV